MRSSWFFKILFDFSFFDPMLYSQKIFNGNIFILNSEFLPEQKTSWFLSAWFEFFDEVNSSQFVIFIQKIYCKKILGIFTSNKNSIGFIFKRIFMLPSSLMELIFSVKYHFFCHLSLQKNFWNQRFVEKVNWEKVLEILKIHQGRLVQCRWILTCNLAKDKLLIHLYEAGSRNWFRG